MSGPGLSASGQEYLSHLYGLTVALDRGSLIGEQIRNRHAERKRQLPKRHHVGPGSVRLHGVQGSARDACTAGKLGLGPAASVGECEHVAGYVDFVVQLFEHTASITPPYFYCTIC